jgi:hypothetical protein
VRHRVISSPSKEELKISKELKQHLQYIVLGETGYMDATINRALEGADETSRRYLSQRRTS